MRLLHPKTLEIISKRDDISKAHIARVWSEIFKWKASGQKHPKMFINNDYDLGMYMSLVYKAGVSRGCLLDPYKVLKGKTSVRDGLCLNIQKGFCAGVSFFARAKYFNDNHLFSDACSLYYKGINIFPDIFGDEWRKYVPVESHKEILRQVTKTLNKQSSCPKTKTSRRLKR